MTTSDQTVSQVHQICIIPKELDSQDAELCMKCSVNSLSPSKLWLKYKHGKNLLCVPKNHRSPYWYYGRNEASLMWLTPANYDKSWPSFCIKNWSLSPWRLSIDRKLKFADGFSIPWIICSNPMGMKLRNPRRNNLNYLAKHGPGPTWRLLHLLISSDQVGIVRYKRNCFFKGDVSQRGVFIVSLRSNYPACYRPTRHDENRKQRRW